MRYFWDQGTERKGLESRPLSRYLAATLKKAPTEPFPVSEARSPVCIPVIWGVGGGGGGMVLTVMLMASELRICQMSSSEV